MTPTLTDQLCTRCALCCDGSLFADVELTGIREATELEILGFDVEEDDAEVGLLPLPCAALRGTRCGIYAHRPTSCRAFECGLLQDARQGVVSVEQAQRHIAGALVAVGRVKGLLEQLGQRDGRLPLRERCTDALAMVTPANPDAGRHRIELEAEMSAVERLIRKTFLRSSAVLEPGKAHAVPAAPGKKGK